MAKKKVGSELIKIERPRRDIHSIPSATLHAWCPDCNKKFVIEKEIIDSFDPEISHVDCACGCAFTIDINFSLQDE